jgi:hypothetical protein
VTDISEEYTVPIVRVDEYSVCCLLAWFLKLEAGQSFKISVNFTILHGITFQKIVLFIVTGW